MKYPATHKAINPAATEEEIKEALSKRGMVAFTTKELNSFLDKTVRTSVREGREDGVMDGLRLAMQQRSIADVERLYREKERQMWLKN